MKKFSRLFLIYLLASSPVFGQDPDNLFSRLSALSNSGVIFYNVDGIEISSEQSDSPFSVKNIAKSFRRYSIKEKELLASDSALGYRNFYIQRTSGEAQGMSSTLSYYFIETSDGGIMGLTFARVGKADNNFDRMFARMVRENTIPSHVFSSLRIDSIQFAGRKILLGSSCRWMGVNNVQCPYYGQMNWSVHKNLEGAELAINNHVTMLKARKGGKVVIDSLVAVVFEGAETQARKIVYDFTGVSSALVGMSGGKTLTIYLVAAPVRNNFVSCVMSFWNNDNINPSGLAPLLEKVMKLK